MPCGPSCYTKVKKGVLRRGGARPFWRGTLIDSDTRLRVGRAIGKDEDVNGRVKFGRYIASSLSESLLVT